MGILSDKQLVADSNNRSIRTLLQGLAIDVVVALALTVGTYVATRNSWDEMEWIVLSFSVFKSLVQAVAAYVMRRWLDKSSLPTPLPPDPVPEPAGDH